MNQSFSPADEYWGNHPELHEIPIYYASSLAQKCMAVYQVSCTELFDLVRTRHVLNWAPFFFTDLHQRHER